MLTPTAATRKPQPKQSAEVNMARRGPPSSTQRPKHGGNVWLGAIVISLESLLKSRKARLFLSLFFKRRNGRRLLKHSNARRASLRFCSRSFHVFRRSLADTQSVPNANATFENEAREVRARVARLVAQLGKRLPLRDTKETEQSGPQADGGNLRDLAPNSGRTDPCLYR